MTVLLFEPVFMERIWGGRRLAHLLGKEIPADAAVGESWEVVDRPEAQSVVASGPFAGQTLGELWRGHRALFGRRALRSSAPAFPLLVKLLDARETLSVQVHPPSHVAAALGGEPKSETWLVLAADPGAHLYVGFRRGVGRAAFERALLAGEDVSRHLHRIDVAAGDAIHIPSGRLHAIGAGCLILEVQESSDTTYRVFDWNRPGLDGRPRALHVEESLASIDFDDIEPGLDPADGDVISRTPWFLERRVRLARPRRVQPDGECALAVVVGGAARCGDIVLRTGQMALLTPGAPDLEPVDGEADVVVVELPDAADG